MHELSITTSIVDIVTLAAKGRRVTRVTLEIGVFSGVVPDAVTFCFDVVAKDTPVEGAKLDIQIIDGLGKCRACGAELAIADVFTPCACGSHDVEVVRGNELKVKTMEVEEAA
jgi:hydrogenase nickel incorporation protein HypA/HybF